MRTVFLMIVLFGVIDFINAEVIPVNKKEEASWLRYLMPLPHEISIKKKFTGLPKDVGIKLNPDSGSILKRIFQRSI